MPEIKQQCVKGNNRLHRSHWYIKIIKCCWMGIVKALFLIGKAFLMSSCFCSIEGIHSLVHCLCWSLVSPCPRWKVLLYQLFSSEHFFSTSRILSLFMELTVKSDSILLFHKSQNLKSQMCIERPVSMPVAVGLLQRNNYKSYLPRVYKLLETY